MIIFNAEFPTRVLCQPTAIRVKKTEEPTPRKIQNAREEGQVAYSTELGTAILLFAGLSLCLIMVKPLTAAIGRLTRWSLDDGLSTSVESLSEVWDVLPVLGPSLAWTLALCAGASFAVLVIAVAQVGPLNAQAIAAETQSFVADPRHQTYFWHTGWVRFALSLVKLIVIASLAVWLVRGMMQQGVPYTTTVIITAQEAAWDIAWLAAKLIAALFLLAILDVLYQRWQHRRDLMMSKQEVKQEMKQSDGDPLLKSRMRQIQREMAQNRMMDAVPQADVVITNPTHVAVALQYDAENMNAPVCVAKGYDEVAQRIKAIAAENDVTMVENVPLARALAKSMKIGQAIPIEHYQAVAEVLAALYKTKRPTNCRDVPAVAPSHCRAQNLSPKSLANIDADLLGDLLLPTAGNSRPEHLERCDASHHHFSKRAP